MVADRISRGILLGGAFGAFSAIFGLSDSMFMAVGIGMFAGLLAGLTLARLDKKRAEKKQDDIKP